MKQIAFNSIVLPETGMFTHALAFRQLKGYLDHMGLADRMQVHWNLFESDTPAGEISGKILKGDFHVAAFSVYPWNVQTVKEVCNSLKFQNDRTFIVCGGPYVSFTAETFMDDCRADMVIKGEGEAVFYRVLKKVFEGDYDFRDVPNLLYRCRGELIRTGTGDALDCRNQHYPLSMEAADSEVFLYETSRGCPFKCRYCSWDTTAKRRITFYPRHKIEKDLEAIFQLASVEFLMFCDSDLFINKRHGVWVLEQIHRLNVHRREHGLREICITLETNPEYLDDQIIDEMTRLPVRGNSISFGLQTINEHVSNHHLNRRFNRERYMRNLRRLIERMKPTNNWVSIEIIYGLPGETYEEYRKTLDFLISEMSLRFIMYFRFLVLPGTYFWDHADDYHLVFEQEAPHALISSNTFTNQEILSARRLAFFMFMFTTFLSSVNKMVVKNISKNRLRVYEEISEHISRHYPEFAAHFSDLFEKHGSLSMMLIFNKYLLDREYAEVRHRIIRESREIVRRHAKK